MDAAGAVGQLSAATDTAKRLHTAATQAQTRGLAANAAQTDLGTVLDPSQKGHYTGPVNGQAHTKPTGSQRSGGDPVERFAEPAMLVESPERVALTTPNSSAAFAGRHLHLTAQRDAHLAAGATIAAAAGDGAGFYAAAGGIKTIANHGSISIEAHDDAMQILADRDVTIASTSARVEVLSKNTIVLQSGQCTVRLDGSNLTFACPGTFTVKGGGQEFVDGASQAAALPDLPMGEIQPSDLAFRRVYADGSPIAGLSYRATLSDGSVLQGATNTAGLATHPTVPLATSASVIYGKDPNPPNTNTGAEVDDDLKNLFGR